MKSLIIKVLLLCVIFIFTGEITYAQECGTKATKELSKRVFADRKKSSSTYSRTNHRLYVKIQPYIIRDGNGNGGLSIDGYERALDGLNARFASANIVFEACYPKFIDDIVIHTALKRKSTKFWDMINGNRVPDAINVYFMDNPLTESGKSVNGYATFPDYLDKSPAEDWVVVKNSAASNGSTLAHEMGHYLNLLHTHEDDTSAELENKRRPGESGTCTINCATTADGFCQTAADPNINGEVGTDCVWTKSENDPCGILYTPPTENLMSYTQRTVCRRLFVQEQIDELRRARTVLRSYISNFCSNNAPTCNDNIQNQGETETDCGGSICKPCHCSDNVKNYGETNVDCGGPCPRDCSTTNPVNLDCESACNNDLNLICSALTVSYYNYSITVSNVQIHNSSNSEKNDIELEYTLIASNGSVVLLTPSAPSTVSSIPAGAVRTVPGLVIQIPGHLNGDYDFKVRIKGTNNSCSTTETMWIGPCKQNLSLVVPINDRRYYEAWDEITSTQELEYSADVIYSAGSKIDLNPGFTANQGSEFTAYSNRQCVNRLSSPETGSSVRKLTRDVPKSLTAAPNPFHSSTTLSFQLEQETEIDLTIFDLNGRAISSLASGIRDEGTYELKWHAQDLPPGIYLARLVAGNNIQTTRVVLTR